MPHLQDIAEVKPGYAELACLLLTKFRRSDVALAMAAYLESSSVADVSDDFRESSCLATEWCRLFGSTTLTTFDDVVVGRLARDLPNNLISTVLSDDPRATDTLATYRQEMDSAPTKIPNKLLGYLNAAMFLASYVGQAQAFHRAKRDVANHRKQLGL